MGTRFIFSVVLIYLLSFYKVNFLVNKCQLSSNYPLFRGFSPKMQNMLYQYLEELQRKKLGREIMKKSLFVLFTLILMLPTYAAAAPEEPQFGPGEWGF